MLSFVALLKISGKTETAYGRLKSLPMKWHGVIVDRIIFGTGGYDAVVAFDAPTLDDGTRFISEHLRDSDPLTLIDVVVGDVVIEPPLLNVNK